MTVLKAAAITVGALAGARFNLESLILVAPPSTLDVAVGMIVSGLGVGVDDALALLRSRAFALSISAPALASDLISGTRRVEDLMDVRDES